MKIDLHVHSAASHDGCASISELVAAAKQKGLDGIAVCDHDRFYDGPLPDDFIVLRGCEFSTPYGHLLGIGLQNAVENAPIPQLIQNIHACGGIAVLAHPFEHIRYADKIDEIAPLLDGVEICNARATRKNKAANQQALDFARRHRLAIFGGSDAHTPSEVGNAYTVVPDISRLTESDTVIGRDSAHFCTAKSQWVRLRKKNASLVQYLRWLMFAVKCMAEDIFTKQEKQYVTYRKDW